MGPITEHAVPALRARLSHVYWIGGGSGAGKSTIAARLAGRRRAGGSGATFRTRIVRKLF